MKTLTIRRARQMLKRAGFEVTNNGRHEKWQHPDSGVTLTFPRGSDGKVLYGFLARKVMAYGNGAQTYFEKG